MYVHFLPMYQHFFISVIKNVLEISKVSIFYLNQSEFVDRENLNDHKHEHFSPQILPDSEYFYDFCLYFKFSAFTFSKSVEETGHQ